MIVLFYFICSEMETNNIPLNIHLVNNFIQLYGMKGDVASESRCLLITDDH